MKHLVFGHHEAVARWVSHQLGGMDFGPCLAVGVFDDVAGDLVAGVVYNRYHRDRHTGDPHMLEASIAATTPAWATRGVLAGIFAYPFEDIGVQRLQATVRRRNKHARRFVERLGFKYEGKGRRAWSRTEDAIVYSMLPDECRWIEADEQG